MRPGTEGGEIKHGMRKKKGGNGYFSNVKRVLQ